jgi:small subunit ribosomal protein S1
MAERELDRGQNGAPPPMDDGWWDAVLQEEDRLAVTSDQSRGASNWEREHGSASPEDWVWARGLYEADDTVSLNVIGFNRGGVLVEANSLRGFVPVSHLISLNPGEGVSQRAECLSSLVGRKLELKVIEYDPERGRLIFSERAAKAGPGKRLEVLSSLKPGDRVMGEATNITRFGVFVDLGGVEGLIHVSELSWGRVRHPSDVAQVGDHLQVQVLSVDPEQGRIALSLKELQPDPWATVEQRFKVGDIVSGTVTNVVKFGAFVGVEPGLEGLIHISELGDGQFLHPRNVIAEGETVRARVVHIDAVERKLGLSLRDVPQGSIQPLAEAGEEWGGDGEGELKAGQQPERDTRPEAEGRSPIGSWDSPPTT